jgi:uroporphyrinogen-III synthase
MARRKQKIWITRAQPGADSTAERVRALGYEPVVAPLLTVKLLADVAVDLSGVAALAFTSANGVRAFAALSGERAMRVFAVGSATAEAAKAAGFKRVLSADGDVSALAAGIGHRRSELIGAVLHPGALEPAGDLVGALEAQGVMARRLILYETVAAGIAPESVPSLVGCDAVLLHSPKAAQVLARLLKTNPAPQMRALGLSKAVLKPLARAKIGARAYPSMPLEGALLNLIDRNP